MDYFQNTGFIHQTYSDGFEMILSTWFYTATWFYMSDNLVLW